MGLSSVMLSKDVQKILTAKILSISLEKSLISSQSEEWKSIHVGINRVEVVMEDLVKWIQTMSDISEHLSTLQQMKISAKDFTASEGVLILKYGNQHVPPSSILAKFLNQQQSCQR